MTYSRLIGALFLLGFLSYGIGSGLATSLVGSSNFLSTIGASQTLLITGAFLIFLNTGVDVGKGVLFFPMSGPPKTGPFLERVSEIMRDQLEVFDAGEEVLSGADRGQVERAREAPGPRTHHSAGV
jgi:hypothetical protein